MSSGDFSELRFIAPNTLIFSCSTTVSGCSRPSFANDEILTEFLRSLHVPDLILLDPTFPRQNLNKTHPNLILEQQTFLIFWRIMILTKGVIKAIAQTGCFELVNHGISDRTNLFFEAEKVNYLFFLFFN